MVMTAGDEMTPRVEECIERLERVYGIPHLKEKNPLDILVTTILSQNTTSKNTHRAFRQLKKAYPDYETLLKAPDKDIASYIRLGGLANTKARRIKEALGIVKRDNNALDLQFLEDMEPDEALNYLLALPGVGPKTAAVVLLFAFGKLFMPVDTHVNRLSRRLGFVPSDASIGEAQSILETITPREKYCSLHVNLIRHGRAICKARSPLCHECVLEDICPSSTVLSHKG